MIMRCLTCQSNYDDADFPICPDCGSIDGNDDIIPVDLFMAHNLACKPKERKTK